MQSGTQIGAMKNSRNAVSTRPNEPKLVYSVSNALTQAAILDTWFQSNLALIS